MFLENYKRSIYAYKSVYTLQQSNMQAHILQMIENMFLLFNKTLSLSLHHIHTHTHTHARARAKDKEVFRNENFKNQILKTYTEIYA